MSNLNIRLRKMRRHLKVSQSEFGAVGGVSQSTQNRYEHTDTDIPISYLDRIFKEYGSDISKDWFYFGKGQMFEPKNKSTLTDNIDGFTPQESQIIAEVTQFSNFLRQRPLRLEVKRRLLELLIESIDQALTELPLDEPVLE